MEVGPRDGLQAEPLPLPTEAKAELVKRLARAGLREIEATSFVSPKWVPQLGDAEALWRLLPAGPLFSALVPNAKGLERALSCGVRRIALFTAASEAFTRKNINMTVADSLAAARDVVARFREQVPEGWVRGYVSTAFECPYSGRVQASAAARVAAALVEAGIDEVVFGDTVGAAGPSEVRALHAAAGLPAGSVAWHFHDTRNTAVANVAAALELGYATFDSSAGGLGGCPYAPGAGGNLATEDLVYFLEREGVATGVGLRALAEATLPVLEALGRRPAAKTQVAVLAASSP